MQSYYIVSADCSQVMVIFVHCTPVVETDALVLYSQGHSLIRPMRGRKNSSYKVYKLEKKNVGSANCYGPSSL